jgi:hypothetical protein
MMPAGTRLPWTAHRQWERSTVPTASSTGTLCQKRPFARLL